MLDMILEVKMALAVMKLENAYGCRHAHRVNKRIQAKERKILIPKLSRASFLSLVYHRKAFPLHDGMIREHR